MTILPANYAMHLEAERRRAEAVPIKKKDQALESRAAPASSPSEHDLTPTPSSPAYDAARTVFQQCNTLREPFLDGEDDDQDHDHEDGGTEEVADADLDKSRRVLPSPADSLGKDVPVRSSHLPRTLGGKVSQRSVGGVSFDFVDNQALGPRALSTLRTAGPDASGSSLHSAGGSVTVQSLNQAAASASIPLPGAPSASPKRVDSGPAPSGHGQRLGKTPSRPAGRMAAIQPESGF